MSDGHASISGRVEWEEDVVVRAKEAREGRESGERGVSERTEDSSK